MTCVMDVSPTLRLRRICKAKDLNDFRFVHEGSPCVCIRRYGYRRRRMRRQGVPLCMCVSNLQSAHAFIRKRFFSHSVNMEWLDWLEHMPTVHQGIFLCSKSFFMNFFIIIIFTTASLITNHYHTVWNSL